VYLHVTGYPEIGSGGLHIAHMLWGGALMLIAIVIALSFLGSRAHRLTAIVGGVGFGVFIDELGKFITKDNDYFYQPAIGLIYAIFIVLYLSFNFLSRTKPLTPREYHLNALAQLEEAILHDLDPTEKARVEKLLAQAEQQDPITKQLKILVSNIRTLPAPTPSWPARLAAASSATYERFWHRRRSDTWIRGFFLAEVGAFIGGVLIVIYAGVDGALDIFRGGVPYSVELVWGQLVSAVVAAGFAVRGALQLRTSRLRAYEQFRRATMVNIFLTQFFMFSRIEFGALPGFLFNLILLGVIGYAIRQEQRLHTATY
jgi:hypothetical protein